MFQSIKKEYDVEIKKIEQEIVAIENTIMEQEYEIEVLKNNIVLTKPLKSKEIKYSLKYDKTVLGLANKTQVSIKKPNKEEQKVDLEESIVHDVSNVKNTDKFDQEFEQIRFVNPYENI